MVIDAHPESFRLEEIGNRIFVNVPDKKEIEVIDRVTLGRYDCGGDFGGGAG